MKVLNDSNFVLYAAANYINVQCYDTDEFYEDLGRFKYLKKLFSRYSNRGDLKERLILNHLITLYNVFEKSATTRMLFYRTEDEHWDVLKTFLLFLGYMPDRLDNIRDENTVIRSDEIPVDLHIANVLRNI